MNNRYGLDASYFRSKLALISRDLDSFTPEEAAEAFSQLSKTAVAHGQAHAKKQLEQAQRDAEVMLNL